MATTAQTASRARFEFLLRMGDNCLILGHRLSEWCGHTPVLEEDIAIANVALDLIGQARLWLGLAGEVEGQGRSADGLAYLRDASAFRNFLLTEQPNGDFGHTLMRQFLFDAWHRLMLDRLSTSMEPRVAEIANKAVKEVTYHLDRSSDLVVRLGDGTEDSHRRMQDALNLLWPLTGQMFVGDTVDEATNEAGIGPLPEALKADWGRFVSQTLDEATLEVPANAFQRKVAARTIHSEHLGYVLAEMQFLQRAYPAARW